MGTTTIRLPDELKARVAIAAKRARTTSHNFILEAVAEKAVQAERHDEFDAVADARFAHIFESGKAIAWDDMRKYLKQRISNARARRPAARKLAK